MVGIVRSLINNYIYFGSDLAVGNWNIIRAIIEESLNKFFNVNLYIVEYKKQSINISNANDINTLTEFKNVLKNIFLNILIIFLMKILLKN